MTDTDVCLRYFDRAYRYRSETGSVETDTLLLCSPIFYYRVLEVVTRGKLQMTRMPTDRLADGTITRCVRSCSEK
jgi:hypothetical protein